MVDFYKIEERLIMMIPQGYPLFVVYVWPDGETEVRPIVGWVETSERDEWRPVVAMQDLQAAVAGPWDSWHKTVTLDGVDTALVDGRAHWARNSEAVERYRETGSLARD